MDSQWNGQKTSFDNLNEHEKSEVKYERERQRVWKSQFGPAHEIFEADLARPGKIGVGPFRDNFDLNLTRSVRIFRPKRPGPGQFLAWVDPARENAFA